MKLNRTFVASAIGIAGLFSPVSYAQNLDSAKIERLVGIQGNFDEKEKVFKISVPRSDLKLDIQGVKMIPALGLTSWTAFTKTGDHAIVMGDLVLLSEQVNPVMTEALENGLDVTALHNHFFWDAPKVWFMHVGGMGNEEKLASAVAKVFAKIKSTSAAKEHAAEAQVDPAKTTLDPKKIEQIIGASGKMDNGVYKVTIGRTTRMHDIEVGKEMGINTWAAFAGSDTQAVVDGDFAVFETELQPVLKALRHANINIVAIHNHMTFESPRVLFLHYWGIGPTAQLANGLKSALDQTKDGGR